MDVKDSNKIYLYIFLFNFISSKLLTGKLGKSQPITPALTYFVNVYISHLGMSMDIFLQPQHMVKARIRKFFGAVDAVLGQIGGMCSSEKVWL